MNGKCYFSVLDGGCELLVSRGIKKSGVYEMRIGGGDKKVYCELCSDTGLPWLVDLLSDIFIHLGSIIIICYFNILFIDCIMLLHLLKLFEG